MCQLGRQSMDWMDDEPNPTQPSQAARDAAADLEDLHPVFSGDATRAGDLDNSNLVQAFARFERDTEKRVRESVAGEANVERVAQALQDHMEQHHGIVLKASEWDAAALATLERTTDADQAR